MNENRQLQFSLDMPAKSMYAFLKWVVAINIFFLIGTWLQAEKVIFPNSETAQWLLVELTLAKENVAAAWYSSMLLFTVGLAAAICFWADVQYGANTKWRILNYGWIAMALLFAMLSFDEMGSFHEMIGKTSLFMKAGKGIGGGRYFLYAIILAVAIFMVAFFLLKFKNNKLPLVLTIIGVLFFVSNPVQERFEINSWKHSPDPNNWHRPVFYLLLEEGTEVFASFCFLFSFIAYAINAVPAKNGAVQLKAAAGNKIIVWVALLACMLGLMMWVIRMNAWNIPGDDSGVPQDWPPSVTAFACFVAAVYLYFKKELAGNRFVYLFVALVALFASAYFASFMYGYHEGPFRKMRHIMLAFTAVAALFAVLKLKGIAAKVLFAAWAGLMLFSFFSEDFPATMHGYAAFACLLLGLFLHHAAMGNAANRQQ